VGWKRERAAGSDTDGPSPGAGGQTRRLTSRSALAAKLAAREGKLAAIPVTPESEETRTLHPRQESETPLLAVVKILIQRRQGIGIVLEPSAAGGERIGGALSALDWIFCRLFAARTECTVAARCGKIAVSLFERRPRFFLLGRQLQSGMEPSDTRINKGGTIFLADLQTPRKVRAGRRLLCIGGHSRDEYERGGTGGDGLEHGDLLAQELGAPLRQPLVPEDKLSLN